MEEKRVDEILDAITNAERPLLKEADEIIGTAENAFDTASDAAENTFDAAVSDAANSTASTLSYDYDAAPATSYSYDSSLDAPEPAKKKLSGKAIAIIVAVVVAILCLIASLVDGNSISFGKKAYQEPIDVIEKYYNLEKYDTEKSCYDYLNGFMADEFQGLRNVLHNSDYYMSLLDEATLANEEYYQTLVGYFGEGFKLTIKINDETALTADELEQYRQDIQSEIDWLYDYIDYTSDFTDEDWEYFAEYELGTSVETAKKYVALCGELGERYANIEVSEGYTLDATYHVTTDDVPYVEDVEFTVLCVDGHWIEYDYFAYAIDLYYYWE